ncbi:hypothetical protein KR026_010037, partial [Drosophila bipectinata]
SSTMMTFWLLVLITVTLNPRWPEATSASMFQFLEGRNTESDQNWSHLLPTNFYSEINQQYYRRFRRHTRIGKGRWKQPPLLFEYARYI